MIKTVVQALIAAALSSSVCVQAYGQNVPDKSKPLNADATPSSSIPAAEEFIINQQGAQSQASECKQLRGFVDQLERNDRPAEKINGLIETKPVTGNPNVLRWIFSPMEGRGSLDHWMKQAHPAFALSAYKHDSTLPLLEVVGNHERGRRDHYICGIPCNQVSLNDFAADTSKVLVSKGPQVLIESTHCGCHMYQQPARDFSEEAQSIRDFVDKGGYMLITGRDLDSVDKIFPGLVAPVRGVADHDHLYDAQLVKPDAVLGNNLVTDARWYVPEYYPLLKVLNPDVVRVLSSSHQLAKALPETNGVLAAIFHYGKGYVMCLAGTIDNTLGVVRPGAGLGVSIANQLPDAAPKIHIAMRQALAANFIEAGLEGMKIPMQPTIFSDQPD